MPRIVEYDKALVALTEQGLRCLYHNSGAFGFAGSAPVEVAGWIGPEDSTIRPQALAQAKRVAPPFALMLARLAGRAWTDLIGNETAWMMPMSHWSFELTFGNQPWLGEALGAVGIDAALLKDRNDASPIEFEIREADMFERLMESLLANLRGSDFAAVFPGRDVLCTVHHHQQLWWQSTDSSLIAKLRQFDHLGPAMATKT